MELEEPGFFWPSRTFDTMVNDHHLMDKSKTLPTPHKKPLAPDEMLHEADERKLI